MQIGLEVPLQMMPGWGFVNLCSQYMTVNSDITIWLVDKCSPEWNRCL